jgi:hypothetical protein
VTSASPGGRPGGVTLSAPEERVSRGRAGERALACELSPPSDFKHYADPNAAPAGGAARAWGGAPGTAYAAWPLGVRGVPTASSVAAAGLPEARAAWPLAPPWPPPGESGPSPSHQPARRASALRSLRAESREPGSTPQQPDELAGGPGQAPRASGCSFCTSAACSALHGAAAALPAPEASTARLPRPSGPAARFRAARELGRQCRAPEGAPASMPRARPDDATTRAGRGARLWVGPACERASDRSSFDCER